MKKVYAGLAIAALLTGCASTSTPDNRTEATVKSASEVSSSKNLIRDPQFTKFRASNGGKGAWIKDVPNKAAHGNVSSSKDTAFDDEGSARIRFKAKNPNLYAQPGVSQMVTGLEKNTDYQLSLYYSDKRRNKSYTELIMEVTNKQGDEIARKKVHNSELTGAPRGKVKSHFRQTFLTFNSGNNTTVKISAKLGITDPSQIDLNGDIGKQTEIRVDDFVLIKD